LRDRIELPVLAEGAIGAQAASVPAMPAPVNVRRLIFKKLSCSHIVSLLLA
jgi:hypothetical protein